MGAGTTWVAVADRRRRPRRGPRPEATSRAARNMLQAERRRWREGSRPHSLSPPRRGRQPAGAERGAGGGAAPREAAAPAEGRGGVGRGMGARCPPRRAPSVPRTPPARTRVCGVTDLAIAAPEPTVYGPEPSAPVLTSGAFHSSGGDRGSTEGERFQMATGMGRERIG